MCDCVEGVKNENVSVFLAILSVFFVNCTLLTQMRECLSFSLLRWNGNSNQSHVVKGKKTSLFLFLTSLVCRDKMAIKCLFSHLPVSQGKETKIPSDRKLHSHIGCVWERDETRYAIARGKR